MSEVWRKIVAGVGVVSLSAFAGASDLTIHLKGSGAIERKMVNFQCDATGEKLGLPGGVLSVEYLNGAGNHLGWFR